MIQLSVVWVFDGMYPKIFSSHMMKNQELLKGKNQRQNFTFTQGLKWGPKKKLLLGILNDNFMNV
jgi:hypothetical protein